jgi:hypothetical protein
MQEGSRRKAGRRSRSPACAIAEAQHEASPDRYGRRSDDRVARGREFWNGYEKKLNGHPGFADNNEARKAFSKLRSAIAGLYAFRGLDDEAEAAFRQAIRLCPGSPEASFRLARMFDERGRTEDAVRVMEAYVAAGPLHSPEKAASYLEELRDRATGERGE